MITVESFHKPCGCRSVGECNDMLDPVKGAVLDRNGWPTLIVRGNEEAHVLHAGARYLYSLTDEEVRAVNKMRARLPVEP